MNQDQYIEIAKGIFENHPSATVLHITTDGQAFEREDLAFNHAKSLDDKVVMIVKKDDLFASVASAEVINDDEVASPPLADRNDEPVEEVKLNGKKKVASAKASQ
jgi:hypothetical protein